MGPFIHHHLPLLKNTWSGITQTRVKIFKNKKVPCEEHIFTPLYIFITSWFMDIFGQSYPGLCTEWYSHSHPLSQYFQLHPNYFKSSLFAK